MAYWLAVEVAFVSHSILKQIGEPLGKVKAVHSPSPPHWVAKPIAVLSKELKVAVIDNSALKQYLHEAQYNTCIRGTLSSVSLMQRNVNVIPRVCSLLCPLAFAGSSIYNLQDIVSLAPVVTRIPQFAAFLTSTEVWSSV